MSEMTFYCDSCERLRDFHTEYGILIAYEKSIKRICRICRRPRGGAPDVFWDGKPEENLADDPRTGKPRVFNSKAEKAAYLKERGIVESGDRVGGAPVFVSRMPRPKSDSRHEVMMALKRVKEMGIDNRRQEYYRIRKEGERHAQG